MSTRHIACAVMFADIAGSTRLYERLGNEAAQERITGCLSLLSEVAERFDGETVKLIGDEVMCRFGTADAAIEAACAMHEAVAADSSQSTPVLRIHIGLHFGPAILQEGDLYGDAVNVSARMREVAKGGQIITTAETMQLASPETRLLARPFDHTEVEGREEAIEMHQILWEQSSEVTVLAQAPKLNVAQLRLRYLDDDMVLDPTDGNRLIGRDATCDLVVGAELTSRHHARIRYARGKFVLVDQSTNGTYVLPNDGREVYLRREALAMQGEGVISLGCPCADEDDHLIHYSCE